MLILLVEDHEDTRRAMATLLGLSGHVVTPVGDGAEALATVDGRKTDGHPPFDCAVIDLGLPDIAGTDLMRKLLARGPVVGIALTGSTAPADIARCREAGFAQHIPKPVTIEQLEEALERVSRP